MLIRAANAVDLAFLHCPLLDNSGGVWIVTADTMLTLLSKGKLSGCMST